MSKVGRARLHWIALSVVILAMAGFVAGPAALALRPAAVVEVAVALPAPDADPADPIQPTSDALAPGRTVQAAGWLEAEPFSTAIPALAEGVVQTVHVLEGEEVRRGQRIAELVPDDAQLALRRAEGAVSSAEAQLKQAEAEHAAAKADWEQPVERTRQVAVAKAAVAEAEAQLAILPSQIDEASASLKRWEEEQARVEEAHRLQAANERERLIARYEVASRAAVLAALRKQRPLLEARIQRLQAESDAAAQAASLRIEERRALDQAAALVQQAEAQLSQAQADLAIADLRMQRMTITAPMNGYVLRRLKRPGDKVMLGSDDPHSAHLIHLYDPNEMQVRVDVPLADAAQVRIGQVCEVVVDVLPDDVFAGKVTRITHEADLQKNTLQMKVKLLQPSPVLRPEMLARVRFLGTPAADSSGVESVSLKHARLRVPQDCVSSSNVFVVRQRQGTTGQIAVTDVRVLEQHEDGWVTIEGSLHVGDLLVRQPGNLKSGDRVRITASGGGAA